MRLLIVVAPAIVEPRTLKSPMFAVLPAVIKEASSVVAVKFPTSGRKPVPPVVLAPVAPT